MSVLFTTALLPGDAVVLYLQPETQKRRMYFRDILLILASFSLSYNIAFFPVYLFPLSDLLCQENL